MGKEVLNSVKESEQQQQKEKKIFTITPEGFLKVTDEPLPKPINRPIKLKRIMMKKNKCTPLTTVMNVSIKHTKICLWLYSTRPAEVDECKKHQTVLN